MAENNYNSNVENNFPVENHPSCLFKDDRMFVWYRESYQLVLYREIAFLKADRDYCFIHFRDGGKWLVVHPMKTVLQHLPASHFMRIHRSFTINLDCVTRFLGNTVYIGDHDFTVSPAYREALFGSFTFLGSVRTLHNPSLNQ